MLHVKLIENWHTLTRKHTHTQVYLSFIVILFSIEIHCIIQVLTVSTSETETRKINNNRELRVNGLPLII